MRQGCVIKSLVELENEGVIQLGRGIVISKKDLKSIPGNYPVYSSAQLNNGVFGYFGNYMFDEELITWSVDGGGALFHRNKHKFSITNVGGFCRVLKSDILNVRYLFFMLSYLHSTVQFDWVKKAHPSVLRKEYKTIPIPPHSEQQRIVSILDEAFKAIDQAKANTERNLKNARELFDSYLQEVFENGNWETKAIKEISKVVNGYAFASKDFKPTNRVKSVKITNVGVKEFVEEADNYLPEKFKETLKDFQVKSGNIVIALTRTIISAGLKVAIVPASYDGALVNQRVAALVPNEKLANQNFLYYFLTTIGVAKYVIANVNTLMQPNLSINALRNLRVPCPPLKEQQTIVHHFDALRAETLKLEAVYQKKLSNLDELKKSILQKAFAGELTTDEAIAV